MAITLRPVSLRAHDWRHDRRPLSECARHAYAIAMVEAMKQYQVEGHCVAPKKPKLVDTAVFELASSFVTDIEGGSAEDVQSLAEAIQSAIEDEMHEIEKRAAKRIADAERLQ